MATSSDSAGRAPRSRTRAALVAALAGFAGFSAPLDAQVLLTQEEALGLAFPAPAEIERRTAYLDEDQLARIERESDVASHRPIVTFYVGHGPDGPLGVAYFDVHRVRTLPEVLMVVVDPTGRVERIEVLRFAEPREYLAPGGWLRRFSGRRLTGDLENKNAVAGMTGATLTSRAVTRAVRRVLALHAFLDPLGESSRP